MHLGDSRLQSVPKPERLPCGCDLHLGDSRLQFQARFSRALSSCDLHLGDSRLQLPCLKCFNTGVLSFFLVKKMIIVPVLFQWVDVFFHKKLQSDQIVCQLF